MIDPTARLALSARSAAMSQRLNDFAQRQVQRERALDALAHHQQKLTHQLQHLVRDVHQLGDDMLRLEERLSATRPLRAGPPAAREPSHPVKDAD
ncbi:MAG: hypothetical protein ACRYHA_33410 [Janthinobacterium lividum]